MEFHGLVVSGASEPVAGAEVTVSELRRTTISDGEGRFTLAIPPGRVEIRVARIGFATAQVRLDVRQEDLAEPVRIVLRATPLTLPGLEVTATPGGRDALAVMQATSQLFGRSLERETGASLAQTLRTQPGMAVRFMGPAATMPIIRGLTGDRVLMLQDGQRAADLAGSADDHSVTIDPLAADRIEVVRGPATLIYGNNAVGGVVNVISDDIATTISTRPEGRLAIQTESAFPGLAGSARGSLPIGRNLVVTARGAARRTGDMRIGREPELGTRLDNTDLRSAQGAVGLGWIGEGGSAGVAVRGYDFAYGLPVPVDADPVGLEGERFEVAARAELTPPDSRLTSFKADVTVQEYVHEEIDRAANDPLQSFQLGTSTADVVARHGAWGPVSEGAWGASLLVKDYAATGPEALTPAADSRGVGVFAFQEIAPFGEGGPALQLGGRFDSYLIESEMTEKFGVGHRRTFQAISGAAGVRVPLSPAVTASAHLGRSFRAPTVEEMFSAAAHAGTGAVEIGDPALDAERGLSLEGVVRARSARWNAQIAIHRNAIGDYVHLAAVGDTVLLGTVLPVLRYRQDDAVLAGMEGSIEWAATSSLILGVMGDYLRAGLADGTPLSYMPPPRLGVLARWEEARFTLGGDVHHEFEQRRVGPADEALTPAITILRIHAGARFRVGGRTHSIMLRAENLTNVPHREATSRVKDFAPGPGRNVALAYRLYY